MSNPPVIPMTDQSDPLAGLGGASALANGPTAPAAPPLQPLATDPRYIAAQNAAQQASQTPNAPPVAQRFFDAFDAANRPKKTITLNPQTGQMSITEEPGKPLDWARAALTGAMAGLGAASTTKINPGVNGRLAGAGIGYNAAQAQNQEQVQQAQKTAAMSQEEAERAQTMQVKKAEEARAQLASVVQQHVWDRDDLQHSQDAMDKAIQIANINKQLGVKPIDGVPEFGTTEDAMAYINKHPDMFHKDYTWQMVRDPKTNQVQIAERPQNWDDRFDREVTFADGTKETLPNATAQEAGLYLAQKDSMLKDRADILRANAAAADLTEDKARSIITAPAGKYSPDQVTQAQKFINDARGEKINAAKELAISTGKGTEAMYRNGIDPLTKQRLNLSNAPDEFMVNQATGQPIPQSMLTTLKPTPQENNRADFAKSTLHTLSILDDLKKQGKLPNGPISGLTAQQLAKAGVSNADAQEAISLISLAQSSATGAHVGGRFNSEIMDKMSHLLSLNMNSDQFQGAEDAMRDVMQPYADQGGRETVAQFKQNLVGQSRVVNGKTYTVTGFDDNGQLVLSAGK